MVMPRTEHFTAADLAAMPDDGQPCDVIQVTIGDQRCTARLEEALAPATCAAFRALLPLRGKLLQARWSGQAAWVPLDDLHIALKPENELHRPAPGQVLFYPEGQSGTEILIPYGETAFAARCGPLSGNHFLTLDMNADQFLEIGRRVWWEGAQEILFEEASI
jgi:Protein of unknown function (DUF3830)